MALYPQTDYFQVNSVFVAKREAGDLLGVDLHKVEGGKFVKPLKSGTGTFSRSYIVCLFQLKFYSFCASSKDLVMFSLRPPCTLEYIDNECWSSISGLEHMHELSRLDKMFPETAEIISRR